VGREVALFALLCTGYCPNERSMFFHDFAGLLQTFLNINACFLANNPWFLNVITRKLASQSMSSVVAYWSFAIAVLHTLDVALLQTWFMIVNTPAVINLSNHQQEGYQFIWVITPVWVAFYNVKASNSQTEVEDLPRFNSWLWEMKKLVCYISQRQPSLVPPPSNWNVHLWKVARRLFKLKDQTR
jgi:hypothetical protein